jgi:hypothetical protein
MTLQKSLEGFTDYRMSERTRIVQAIADFRREWQKSVRGGSLLKVEAPVGLVLADIADRLQLTPSERHAMLGGKLINEVDCLMDERIVAKFDL